MTTCPDFIQPLDFECIFLNTFAGNVGIFIPLAFIVFSTMAGFFKMPSNVFFVMIGLFLVILAGFKDVSFFLLFILIASLIFFKMTGKIAKD